MQSTVWWRASSNIGDTAVRQGRTLPFFIKDPPSLLRLVESGSPPEHHSYARHIKVTVGEKDGADIWRACVGGDFVPEYFFVVLRNDQEETRPPAVVLRNDAAALRHAERTIAELQMEKSNFDPTGFVIVRNEKNEIILSLPFPPACA